MRAICNCGGERRCRKHTFEGFQVHVEALGQLPHLGIELGLQRVSLDLQLRLWLCRRTTQQVSAAVDYLGVVLRECSAHPSQWHHQTFAARCCRLRVSFSKV